MKFKIHFKNIKDLNNAIILTPASTLSDIDFESNILTFKDKLTRDMYYIRFWIDKEVRRYDE